MRLSERFPILSRISFESPYLPAPLYAVFLFFLLRVAFHSSGVCDEIGAHIPSGFLYWEWGRFCGGNDNFPLGQLLIALPARLFGLSYKLFTEENLIAFRLPVIAMAMGLAALIHRFASEFYGRRVAFAALFFIVFCPNLIAHGSLATLDVPIAFFVFLSVYLTWRYVSQPSPGRMAALSAAVAAGVCTKIQGLLLIPLCLGILILRAKALAPADRKQWLYFFATWSWLLLIPAVAVNIAYLHLPGGDALLPPLFVEALVGKFSHGMAGHPAYLMGTYRSTGWWYYFPVAIAVKTPLPLLALALWGAVKCRRIEERLFILLPTAFFLVGLIFMNINIGLRHALLIYPFLYILAGRALEGLLPRYWKRAALLALWYAVQTTLVTPYQLSYFNELAGGPRNGHRMLIDSNYDWGQNDNAVRRYIAKKGLDYKIDPDPTTPVAGHILVNTNAYYGLLGGRQRAYEWLKSREPVNRVAYTWFEYEVEDDARIPPAQDRTPYFKALAELVDFQAKYRDVRSPYLRISLARAFSAVRAYDLALDEARFALKIDPAFQPAMVFGGETVVRHKLGVLWFEGDQYLTGFHSLEKLKASGATPGLTPEEARALGLADHFAKLYHDLGLSYLKDERFEESAQAMREATAFNDTYVDAYSMLAFALGVRMHPKMRGCEQWLSWAQDLSQRKPADGCVLDVLAAAYAANGLYGDALKTALQADQLSTSDSNQAWLHDLRMRINIYRQKAPSGA
ncbi:MAG TPA: glycosyltransferase family 39 protein [Candidatus Eisenbacteria bacterium]|nr:glycosyltransferase family 39 protein [Candidatus Eisenbacteria bacterium]